MRRSIFLCRLSEQQAPQFVVGDDHVNGSKFSSGGVLTTANSTDLTVLCTEYKATTNRMLRVAVNGFMESLGLVLGVMEELDVDVLQADAG